MYSTIINEVLQRCRDAPQSRYLSKITAIWFVLACRSALVSKVFRGLSGLCHSAVTLACVPGRPWRSWRTGELSVGEGASEGRNLFSKMGKCNGPLLLWKEKEKEKEEFTPINFRGTVALSFWHTAITRETSLRKVSVQSSVYAVCVCVAAAVSGLMFLCFPHHTAAYQSTRQISLSQWEAAKYGEQRKGIVFQCTHLTALYSSQSKCRWELSSQIHLHNGFTTPSS